MPTTTHLSATTIYAKHLLFTCLTRAQALSAWCEQPRKWVKLWSSCSASNNPCARSFVNHLHVLECPPFIVYIRLSNSTCGLKLSLCIVFGDKTFLHINIILITKIQRNDQIALYNWPFFFQKIVLECKSYNRQTNGGASCFLFSPDPKPNLSENRGKYTEAAPVFSGPTGHAYHIIVWTRAFWAW